MKSHSASSLLFLHLPSFGVYCVHRFSCAYGVISVSTAGRESCAGFHSSRFSGNCSLNNFKTYSFRSLHSLRWEEHEHILHHITILYATYRKLTKACRHHVAKPSAAVSQPFFTFSWLFIRSHTMFGRVIIIMIYTDPSVEHRLTTVWTRDLLIRYKLESPKMIVNVDNDSCSDMSIGWYSLAGYLNIKFLGGGNTL